MQDDRLDILNDFAQFPENVDANLMGPFLDQSLEYRVY